MAQRRMHLVAYLKTGPTALHVGGWRHPESTLDDILDPSLVPDTSRACSRTRSSTAVSLPICSASTICTRAATTAYVRRGGQISFLDPTVVLPVMAAATSHLGLGATLSTSFHTAYHLARWLGSLDVLSKGRVAWERGDVGDRAGGAERRARCAAAARGAL